MTWHWEGMEYWGVNEQGVREKSVRWIWLKYIAITSNN